MKEESQRKLKAFARFGLLVGAPAIVAAIFLLQLVDPSVFGEKHPVICWGMGLGLLALAAYNLYIVRKGSNTGSQA